MQLPSDLLIDRKQLKAKLASWRAIALLLAVVIIALATGMGNYGSGQGMGGDYIAQISIEGVMVDDAKRDELIKRISDDPRAKAVLVKLDSPGGTTIAGEVLYLQLSALAKKKPVIGVMHTLCASACYMASLGTEHVIARQGTLTGSIGVLMQSMEISRLADKLGITPITIKSGAMKDVPSLGEPMTETERSIVSEVVMDAYEKFVDMIVARRKIDVEKTKKLADGRVYTGSQALQLGLIDGIGGDDEALIWLHEQHKINPSLAIHEVKPPKEFDSLFEELTQYAGIKIFGHAPVGLDGLVSMWHPSSL